MNLKKKMRKHYKINSSSVNGFLVLKDIIDLFHCIELLPDNILHTSSMMITTFLRWYHNKWWIGWSSLHEKKNEPVNSFSSPMWTKTSFQLFTNDSLATSKKIALETSFELATMDVVHWMYWHTVQWNFLNILCQWVYLN